MKDWQDTPWQRLVGSRIVAVERDRNETSLVMESGNSITLYLEDQFVADAARKASPKKVFISLDDLIGRKIERALLTGNNDLVFDLEGGRSLALIFDQLPYEAYVLTINNLSYFA